jgi:predicted nuclease of predicted toxin-antitoxin system
MKLLIDEQLPTKLKYRFSDTGYEIYTVRDMQWLGKKNGELLQLMSDNKFDVLLTNDKNLYYQQKLSALSFSIVNINTKTNRYDNILLMLDLIKSKLKEVELHLKNEQTGRYYIINE